MPSTEKQREASPAEPDAGSAPATNGSATDGATGDATGDGASGESTSADWAERCANCGAALHGAYCHECGQRQPEPSDYSLTAFLWRGLATITHLDGRFYRTVRALFLRPGRLSREHFRGRRARYLSPLRLFLVFNVVFFLLSTTVFKANTFRTPLRYHVNSNNFFHDRLADDLVQERLAEEGLTFEAFADRFDRRAAVLSKTLVISMVPGIALLLLVLHAGRERRYVKHLVFALHFVALMLVGTLLFLFAFSLLAGSLVWLVGQFTGGSAGAFLFGQTTLNTLVSVFLGGYLALALRRAYGQPWWLAAAKTVPLLFGLLYLLLAYRALLFFITFYTL